jgi:hypothetical protein
MRRTVATASCSHRPSGTCWPNAPLSLHWRGKEFAMYIGIGGLILLIVLLIILF